MWNCGPRHQPAPHPPLDKIHTAAAVYVSPAPTPLPPVRRKLTRARRSHNDLGTHHNLTLEANRTFKLTLPTAPEPRRWSPMAPG